MRDSTTYQGILEEGRAEGEVKGRADEARRLLLLLGRKQLGAVDEQIEAAIHAIADVQRLESLVERVTDVASWAELLQTS